MIIKKIKSMLLISGLCLSVISFGQARKAAPSNTKLEAKDKPITFTATFGGSHADEAYSVQQTKEGGYIVAGYTSSFGAGEYDFWLVKTDANGDSTWSKTFGGSCYDVAHSVQQTSDSAYIVAGGMDRDLGLVKTDKNGNIDSSSVLQ